jgi:indolepyruvate ferredoxin oxidoreductase, alpha subunit
MSKLTVTSDAPGERIFMLGNEAIARGAIEAGVQLAAAYPGTPSSEIVETLADVAAETGMYVEWSTNEKVAFEVALAASLTGQRALVTMKHVGVNVAHDPLMVAAYIGARGPLVLVAADDPWAWSSQNEQDTRFVAEQAYYPILEPSSVAEAKEMTAHAFKLSAEYEHPFMLRSVTRVSHGRSDVTLGEIEKEMPPAHFVKDPTRLVYTPTQARSNRPKMLARFARIKEAVNTLPYNQMETVNGAKLGIIASGLAYSYAVEAIKWLGLEAEVSVLKIGTPHPLPEKLVLELLRSVSEALVAEELEPFVENHVKVLAQENQLTLKIHGKDVLPIIGELSTRLVTEALAKLTGKTPPSFAALDALDTAVAPTLPARPPTLCAGCPHRATQHAMKLAGRRVAREMGKGVEAIFPGDIGCYTLSYLPPLESMDTTVCMGGGFGMACGFAQVTDAPVIAQLGDSTFFHSGMAGLVNAVFNQANATFVVLDNSATAMTGFQPHPGTGRTAMGAPTKSVKPEDVARALGVDSVEVVDSFDLKATTEALVRAIKYSGPAVVVSRRPCAVIWLREQRAQGNKVVPCFINQETCDGCGVCVKLLGCPAIVKDDTAVTIDAALCTGCGLCVQVCPRRAIEEVA